MKKLAVITMSVLFAFVANNLQAKAIGQEQAGLMKKESKSDRKAFIHPEINYVSKFSKNNFKEDFGYIPNVVWSRDDNFDMATFTQNGQKTQAFYDQESNLVGTTTEKSFTDLPERSQQEIKTKYKDYSIGPVILFTDNENNDTDMILYGSPFEDADNYFVELTRGNDKIVLRVDTPGFVYFFKNI